MAKRRDSGMSQNLFPFLSILVALIGSLTMIIVVLNLIQMNKGEGRVPEEIEIAKAYVKLEEEIKQERQEADQLRQLIEKMIQERKDAFQVKEKFRLLSELMKSTEKLEAARDELVAKLNILVSTNKRLEADQKDLATQIEALKKELAARKIPPDAPALRVTPSGSGLGNARPYFLEVADKTVLIHKSLSAAPEVIASASIATDEKFVDFLKEVGSKPSNRLILLVRANAGAVGNLGRVSQMVSSYNAANGTEIIPGRLPLPGEGKVDLSVFAQYLTP